MSPPEPLLGNDNPNEPRSESLLPTNLQETKSDDLPPEPEQPSLYSGIR